MFDRKQSIGNAFLRSDGRKGIRNRLLVLYLSPYAETAARRMAEAFSPETVEVLGFGRCADSPLVERKLIAYATHPNIGATLIVANGGESLSPDNIYRAVQNSGRPCERIVLSHDGGFTTCVERGIRKIGTMLQSLQNVSRVPLYFSDLVIGAECGGSDATSGLAANPVVGRVFDRLCDLGATVLFEEMYEAIGLKDVLLARCATKQAAEEIGQTYDKFFRFCEKSNQFFITPGNMRGGLTTIEEKSMGAVIKSGTRPIQGVVKICQRPTHSGLWMMDSMPDAPDGCGPYTSEDATSLLVYPTCGTLLNLLTSGRGHLINTPITPTIKITGNRITAENLRNDTDIDASPVIYGEQTFDELADKLMERIVRTAAGELTAGEALNHRDGVINQELQYGRGGERL